VAFWSEVEVPPPLLLVDGVHHHFQPARGRVLLGVVELVERAVLLVAVGTRMVAVYREGGVSTVLPLGRPGTIREIDLAHLLDYYGSRAEAKPRTQDEPLRPSQETQAHHIRIVRGRPIDVGAGPPLSEVLAAIFEDIEARATTPKVRPKKLKGKTWVPVVLKYLRELCVSGCRDLVGSTDKIIREIQEECPEFQITSEAFADALKLIAATGTGLIGPRKPRGRIWRINLAELADPTSALHKRLCRETADRPGVVEAANQTSSGQREPPPHGPGRVPAGHAGSRATHGATSASSEHGGSAQGESVQASGDAPANDGGPSFTAHSDDTERPGAGTSSAVPDPATRGASTVEAALRLVNHLSRIPEAGRLLLLWTPEYVARTSEMDLQAANGVERAAATAQDAEAVTVAEVESGGNEQSPDEAGASGTREIIVDDDGGRVGAPEPSETIRGDKDDAQEAGTAACLVDDLDMSDAPERPAGVEVDSGNEPRPDDEADAPTAVGNAIAARVARERPARLPRRRVPGPLSLRACFVRRALRRAAELATLGPRGPPDQRATDRTSRSTLAARRPTEAEGRPSRRDAPSGWAAPCGCRARFHFWRRFF
jgi:hypothetical protein